MSLALGTLFRMSVRRTVSLWASCALFLLTASQVYSQIGLSDEELPVQLTRPDASLKFRSLDISTGMPDDFAGEMIQDSKGFMWIGTFSGLVRYDGYDVRTYRPDPNNPKAIQRGWINNLMEDDDGTIWVGGENGLSHFDPKTERFRRYVHDPNDSNSIAPGAVWSIFKDGRGTMWVGTDVLDTEDGGLSRFNPLDGTFRRFQSNRNDPTSISDNGVTAIAEDLAGNLWIGTRNGLNRFDRDREVFDRFMADVDDPTALSHPNILSVLVDRRGTVWIGVGDGFGRDSNAGLHEFDPQTETFKHHAGLKGDTENLLGSSVASIYEDRNGSLWVGSVLNGLGHFEPRTGTVTPIFRGESVLDIMEDRSGVLWFGTWDKGAKALDRLANRFVHYGHEPNNPASIAVGDVMAVREVPAGSNILWVGSWGGGLTRIDRSNNQIKRYQPDPKDPFSISHPLVRVIFEDSKGVMWLGTWGGLNRYDARTDRFYRYLPDPNDPNSISHHTVRTIEEDHDGILWFGTWGGGLNRFDRETGHFRSYHIDTANTSPAIKQITVVAEDSKNRLWVGTNGRGFYRFDRETETFVEMLAAANEQHDGNISPGSILENPSGDLWLGTFIGLVRYNPDDESFKIYDEEHGLGHRSVKGIMRDGAGRVWVVTDNGIARYDAQKDRFRNYNEADGLSQSKFEARAFYQSPTGEFFMGGADGVDAFFPEQIRDDPRSPAVVITELRLFDEPVNPGEGSPLETGIAETRELTLDYTQNDIGLSFAGLHFVRPEQNQYSYRLEPYDRDWSKPSNRRTAHYTNLDPGSYTFRVKAANNDGVWNEEGARLSILITPPFWQTWWFRISVALLFIGLIYGGVQTRIRQIAERNRKLEATVAERTAELEDRNKQLEQSDTIVEAINKETSFRRLLTKILEEARVIPGVEKATAVVRLPDGYFHIRASSGWDVAAMEHIRLAPDQASARYTNPSEEVAPDVFVARDVAKRPGSTEMAEFGAVASFLVLRVKVEGQVAGYLVFDNLSDPDAFAQRDVALLERLKEHIESAFIKTRLLESLRDQNDQISAQRSELETTLTSLQAAQDRLVQAEKMASLGQLTAGIAHEIKNPLNFVNNFSEMSAELTDELMAEVNSRKGELPADFVAELESILSGLKINSDKISEHGKRADSIVQSMLQHSRGGEGEQEEVDLNVMLDEYVNLAYHGMRARDSDFNVTLNRTYAPGLPKLKIVPQDMGRVLINLLNNAFDALNDYSLKMGEHFKPTVSVSTAMLDGTIEIRIADNGPGIPNNVKKRIFEPFFTTKPTGSGTGLGLSMSYDIVTKGHGGSLDVVSEEGQGATFVVRLPT